MAKSSARFVCQSCGAVFPKWAGRCETCGEWNTIVEEAPAARPGPAGKAARRPAGRLRRPGRQRGTAAARGHRDRGAGPRAGRRAGAVLGRAGRRRSGDRQVHPAAAGRRAARPLRPAGAVRLGRGIRSSRCACAPAAWASPTRRSSSPPRSTCATSPPRWRRRRDAALVVIDSIQTMWLDSIDSAPGTVGQVRASSFELIRLAKAGSSPWCWSATSPRTARWPARACWSTWSMRCCISKATAATSSASCAR